MGREAELAQVSICALGGTIAMEAASDRDGVVPTLTAESLVRGIPTLGSVARISTATLSNLPGASLTPADVLRAVDWARAEVERGSAGAVITQGTDTLEETSFLASLVWDRPAPLVFTGAMRSPAQLSADGPANIVASTRVAAADVTRGSGVTVVLNDEIHEARHVQKAHSTALQAFTSPTVGPLGRVVEQQVRLHRPAATTPTLPRPSGEAYVPLLETHLDDRGETLRAVRDAGADGVVIAAFGVGHVSARLADEVEETVRSGVPVVVSTRTHTGGTLRSTYGFDGSEIDLARRGAVLSGSLDPRKSRILLWTLVAGDVAADEVVGRFESIADPA
ncbi:MAG: asparaginase [Propionibacterium sp.]|nr:asparaginase [Propionibacterium sp.]